MSPWMLLLSLALVDLFAAATPGPNFVLVVETAIHRGTRAAAAVVLGFVVTNALWCGAVFLGLRTLFDAAPWLYGILKLAGAAYLIYLGVSLWRHRQVALAATETNRSRGMAFARGALTNLSNPKAVVYFGSVFSVFMQPGTAMWMQIVAVAIVLTNTIVWYGLVALLLSSSGVQRRYLAMHRVLDRISGTLMIAFGLRLAWHDE